MPAPRPLRPLPEEAPALHSRALDDLRFIRETMTASTAFTAVPGRGMVLEGVCALVAAVFAHRASGGAIGTPAWLAWWAGAALAAAATGLVTMARKARAAGVPLLEGAGRRFALAFAPPMLAGALLTLALLRAGHPGTLPGTWLLLYGVAALAGGAHSVPAVPAMGAAFSLLGTLALFAPAAWGDALLALGFGGLHVVFGAIVWRRHGG